MRRPKSAEELRQVLQYVWNHVPADFLIKLHYSVPKRILKGEWWSQKLSFSLFIGHFWKCKNVSVLFFFFFLQSLHVPKTFAQYCTSKFNFAWITLAAESHSCQTPWLSGRRNTTECIKPSIAPNSQHPVDRHDERDVIWRQAH